MARKNLGIAFDSAAQVERIKQAARIKKISFNRFVVERSAEDADTIIEGYRLQKVAEQVANGSSN